MCLAPFWHQVGNIEFTGWQSVQCFHVYGLFIFYGFCEVKWNFCGTRKMIEIPRKFQYPENIVNCTKICLKNPVHPIFNAKLHIIILYIIMDLGFPRYVYIHLCSACMFLSPSYQSYPFLSQV